ncbi:PREDICTED: probable membrane-associated kinase regulator 1 [Brassica oleracea var. oleracea]|uniref:Membrane-associated kinase regulator 1 n=1 Tax=Brassica oleracea var. oleracea TaxID=109376 RepID=A0A0D3DCN8_BRAOL|nr:PREDICTED: probable membrane-associated kinase regulator 1 [Brassica oleracea var. oleracea]
MRRQPRPRPSPPRSHSSPSSSSSEFEFNVSISPRKASSSLCPADELFYKGQLLPLQLSPRLSLVRTLCSSTSSSDYTSSSSAARDSTESSSSTDSTASFPLLRPPPLDGCDSSRPSSVTDEEDSFFKPTKKNTSGGFSLSRFSSVFKKEHKTVSAAAPSPVKRMSSTAKEVIRKYMKKVKPLYDKLSQKQSTTTVTSSKTEQSSLKHSGNIRGTSSAVASSTAIPAAGSSSGGLSISFSGNLMKYTKRGRCAASCPSSMRSSPSHSGVLTRGGFPGQGGGGGSCSSSINNSMTSSMEELQSAIQGAIAHCKNSMMQKNMVSSLEI